MESCDSILVSIKKMLGMTEEYTVFDPDIIMHINTVFGTLRQLGVGPADGFAIESKDAVWTDFIRDDDLVKFNAVKTYVYLKVRLIFDPPLSGTLVEVINKSINELEWRLNVEAEND